MRDDAYRHSGKEPEVKIDSERRARLVLQAVEATFRSVEFAPLSHYQDHVQNRWRFNLNRALSDCEEFEWATQSRGERYDLMRLGWWKFFWRTRKMPWSATFRWMSERLKARGR